MDRAPWDLLDQARSVGVEVGLGLKRCRPTRYPLPIPVIDGCSAKYAMP